MPVRVVKAHAYGNDFLCVPDADVSGAGDPAALARAMCHRHHGLGGDGLLRYTLGAGTATMRLLNADGSRSELSGNGLRCLAALVAREQRLRPGAAVTIETEDGAKTLELLEQAGHRFTFRAAMGQPVDIRRTAIALEDGSIAATVLRVGNPQCVVLGPLPPPERFSTLGPALATHPVFPEGTNVEFAEVEAPDRVRILIWERGVGPTTSSGTGSAAAAVAAAAHGGASRSIEVVAPGGSQRVDWRPEGVYLTGWAAVVFAGEWLGQRQL